MMMNKSGKIVLTLAIIIVACLLSSLVAYAMGNYVATKGIAPLIIIPVAILSINFVWRFVPKDNDKTSVRKLAINLSFLNKPTQLSQNQTIILSLLIGWTFIHIIFLCISDAPYYWAVKWFWPIEADSTIISHYDRTEFLVYVGFPVVILTVYYLLRRTSVKGIPSHDSGEQANPTLLKPNNKSQ